MIPGQQIAETNPGATNPGKIGEMLKPELAKPDSQSVPDSQPVNDINSLQMTLSSLRSVLENENLYLNSNRTLLLESFAREKLQLLANLDRILRAENTAATIEICKKEIGEISAALNANASALKFRMEAIDEISATIKGAMMDAESDGTYEARNSVGGYGRW